MPALHDLKDEDLQGLAPEAVTALAQQMLQRIRQQAHEIQFKDAKIEKIMFQLAQLKAWKFGAKTEAMNAEQRRLFEETVAEDEASLQAQLGQTTTTSASRVVVRCLSTCAVWNTTTSPRTRAARVRSAAARWCA